MLGDHACCMNYAPATCISRENIQTGQEWSINIIFNHNIHPIHIYTNYINNSYLYPFHIWILLTFFSNKANRKITIRWPNAMVLDEEGVASSMSFCSQNVGQGFDNSKTCKPYSNKTCSDVTWKEWFFHVCAIWVQLMWSHTEKRHI